MSKFSNNLYYSKNYGFLHKLNKVWNTFLDVVRALSTLATFFMIPVSIGLIVNYLIVCYSPIRVVVSCLVLVVMIYSNKKL